MRTTSTAMVRTSDGRYEIPIPYDDGTLKLIVPVLTESVGYWVNRYVCWTLNDGLFLYVSPIERFSAGLTSTPTFRKKSEL